MPGHIKCSRRVMNRQNGGMLRTALAIQVQSRAISPLFLLLVLIFTFEAEANSGNRKYHRLERYQNDTLYARQGAPLLSSYAVPIKLYSPTARSPKSTPKPSFYTLNKRQKLEPSTPEALPKLP